MKLKAIFFFLIAVQCNAQQKHDPQGLWNSSWVENIPTHLETDAAFYQIYHNTDLYFEGDSLWILEYPCKRITVSEFLPESFQLINDSTFDYAGERYFRQKDYDSVSIALLKVNRLNPQCYTGRWNLVTAVSGGDGTGIVYIYPFKIKETLFITDEISNGDVLKLRIEGVEREFYVDLEKKMFENQLILIPTDSWMEKDKKMWMRDWDLPAPNKQELKEIKQGEGIDLELVYRRI